jgi:hypothetical protein
VGNNDPDKENIAGRCCAPSNTAHVIERRCRLIGQMIGTSPKHLFPTSGI